MHLAGSGRVIVKLTEKLEDGQILCDRSGTKIAKVSEIIGSVKSPFASASPLTNNIKKYIGKTAFATIGQKYTPHTHRNKGGAKKRE